MNPPNVNISSKPFDRSAITASDGIRLRAEEHGGEEQAAITRGICSIGHQRGARRPTNEWLAPNSKHCTLDAKRGHRFALDNLSAPHVASSGNVHSLALS